MEMTGTHYLIAVEIAGPVQFGNTNALNGAQWVAAFEQAIETSTSVLCYDYTLKRNFEDTILLIREKPGVVKVVPRTKLSIFDVPIRSAQRAADQFATPDRWIRIWRPSLQPGIEPAHAYPRKQSARSVD
jgi:hypothetical protein